MLLNTSNVFNFSEALTAIAFAIAAAPASPISLPPNLQKAIKSGYGQGSFVKSEQLVRGWSGGFRQKRAHPNAVNEALTAIAFAIAAAPESPILLALRLRTVTEALTAIAFAIAVAPWSPILLPLNLQKASRSGDGQGSFVKKRAGGQGMVRRVSSKASAP